MLLTILIIFFTSIVLYKLICSMMKIVEGMENEYEPYDKNDPNNCLILAQQNAGNVDYLKSRMDELKTVKSDMNNLQQNVDSMQIQLDALVQQNSEMATELAGGTEPAEVSGLEEEEPEEEDQADQEPSTNMEEEI